MGRRNTAPAFAFCEPSWATTESREHIRQVGPEGLLPSGGIPEPALCGQDLAKGWDLPAEVTAETVHALASPRDGDGRVFLCTPCAEVYLNQS